MVGLHVWHGPHTFGTVHAPVAELQVKQFGHAFGVQAPVPGSQVWHSVHLGTHCPFTHFWHLSPLQVLHSPVAGSQVWHNAALHLGTQTLFWHFWQVVQVLTQTPWPLQVWQGPHLLLQTPPTQT
jgi:hypothetical protein